MSHFQVVMFSVGLVLLILISGFFSAAETALMSVNRYRLRHKARLKKKFAIMILKLLKRPDRLLGMVLIGNSFSNIIASALATLIAVHFFGDKGVILSSILLTFVILVFSEVAPKTLAALYSEQVSKLVRWPVFILLKIFYPLVWLVNTVSNGVLRLFRIKVTITATDNLSREELRTVVYETSSRMSHHYQNMLLGILDLNKVTVEDVMVPRHEIVGIDLDDDWEKIQNLLAASTYDWLPVYRDNVNQVVGVLHLRELMHTSLANKMLNKEVLQKVMQEPYFVPEGTTLNVQLQNFQRQKKRFALIVDEYGEILGLLTLADILEEIVGEFSTSVSGPPKAVEVQADGSYLVDGAVTMRELNRITGWSLPMRGPRTVNGMITEYLQSIPHAGTSLKINNHPMEIILVEENRVKIVRIFPRLVKGDEGAEL